MLKVFTKVFFITFLLFIIGCSYNQPQMYPPKIDRKNDATFDLTKLLIVFTPITNTPKYELHIKNEFEKLLKPHDVEVIFTTESRLKSTPAFVEKEKPSHLLIIGPSSIIIRDYKEFISFYCHYSEMKSNKVIFDSKFEIKEPGHVKAGEDRAQLESALLAENLYRELLYKK